jgi:hypothetical protein
MWKAFKGLPVFARILIVVLVVGAAYRVTHLYHGPRGSYPSANFGGGSDDDRGVGGRSLRQGDSEDNGSSDNGSSIDEQKRRMVAQFEAQRMQITRQVQQCLNDTQRYQQAAAMAAMNGQMVPPPQCSQSMAQWTAQEAYLETEIYKLNGGDPNATVRQVSGIAESPGYGSGSRRSAGASDDGTGAVEDWDRGAIRGTSLYTDEGGEQHELPTRSYYFRDRSSGQIVGSDQPNPPNNGRDYEELQMSAHPQ